MKTKNLFLIFILFFVSAFAHAQKGFWLEITGEGKSARGGEYQVPADLLAPAPTWATMPARFSLRGSMGGDACYFFSDHMGLSLGLHYSGTGQDYDDYIWSINGGSIVAERTVSIHYLQLPLQVRYVTFPAQKISLVFAAGFYAGFLLNYGIENKFTASDGSGFTTKATGDTYSVKVHDNSGADSAAVELLSEPFDPNDFGAILSAGFHVKLSDKIALPVMFKYETSFGNVKNKSCVYSYDGGTYLYWEDDFYDSPNLNFDHVHSSLGVKIGLRFAL